MMRFVSDTASSPVLSPVLRAIDAIMITVPDLDSGLAFYCDRLGHRLRWRNDEIGQAGLGLPDSSTEIVLAVDGGYEPNWLVDSVEAAVTELVRAGGTVETEPFDIPVGRVAVLADPFGNRLVLVDLSKGRYPGS
jgi:predicted enzyme related to lactoylglutathione lyase